jgi:K(+)-stimulated pyrophosphate-energized sodium pump
LGISLAALSMLSLVGIQVCIQTFGPIADNAVGISEMSKQKDDIKNMTHQLDCIGNSTAAIGRSYAIGSAILTSLSLFVAFQVIYFSQTNQWLILSVSNPIVLAGLLIGATVVLIIAALTIGSVAKVSSQMIEEIKRQFREIPGLIQGTGRPDTSSCVEITTRSSLREMIPPVLMSVVAPVTVGLGLGAQALGGMLVGALLTGLVLGWIMSIAGAAWDNSKKFIETGFVEGHGKGSVAHKAAEIMDTLGDTFKDAAAPSIIILIKLIAIISLLILPLIGA